VQTSIHSEIRPSTTDDIPAIQQIAHSSWDETYRGLISEESRRDYLKKAYATEWLSKLHSRQDVRGFLALEDGRPVGFAMMSLGSPADDPPGAVLRSLYMLPNAQSKGHGARLLDAVKAAAVERGIPWLWVAVNEKLTPAREWYERHGFVYDGPAEVTIGHDRIREAVYKMPLRAAAAERRPAS
jgi:GNAT superfamily N-acetyltransferase